VYSRTVSDEYLPWRISGSYFESCNCEAICPCRMIGGRRGGRSTYGICFGVLTWAIEDGQAGDVDLSGFGAALLMRYDDDEPGSPWRMVVRVDERGDDRQRDALAKILLGELGGPAILGLPWVRKASDVLDVAAARIEITLEGGRHEVRLGTGAFMSASRPVETDETVACIVPGYDRPGTELYADRMTAADGEFEWELEGNCAFVSRFEYASE
jgi:hypothetical protein